MLVLTGRDTPTIIQSIKAALTNSPPSPIPALNIAIKYKNVSLAHTPTFPIYLECAFKAPVAYPISISNMANAMM
jgi:hypothetical protein